MLLLIRRRSNSVRFRQNLHCKRSRRVFFQSEVIEKRISSTEESRNSHFSPREWLEVNHKKNHAKRHSRKKYPKILLKTNPQDVVCGKCIYLYLIYREIVHYEQPSSKYPISVLISFTSGNSKYIIFRVYLLQCPDSVIFKPRHL